MPQTAGVLEAVDGGDLVRAAPGVLELQLAEPGTAVKAAGSNNEYLGHVMAGDAEGPAARRRVEALLAELRPRVVNR